MQSPRVVNEIKRIIGKGHHSCKSGALLAEGLVVSLRMLSLNRIVEWLNEMDMLRRAQVATAS